MRNLQKKAEGKEGMAAGHRASEEPGLIFIGNGLCEIDKRMTGCRRERGQSHRTEKLGLATIKNTIK